LGIWGNGFLNFFIPPACRCSAVLGSVGFSVGFSLGLHAVGVKNAGFYRRVRKCARRRSRVALAEDLPENDRSDNCRSKRARRKTRGQRSNAIVDPDLFERFRLVITEEAFLLIKGQAQNSDGVVLIKAREIKPLLHESLVGSESHDFH
jgi:hypothetical protein